MQIAGRKIGPEHPPYIIAEVSGNHKGSFGDALRLIRTAKEAGADAVKFQAYSPSTITIDCDNPDFIIKDGIWKGQKLFDLYRKTYTPFHWFRDLFVEARHQGIACFASVFDQTSVDMLERLGCPVYKIASMEIVDIPLIEYAAKTGKPLIISTGMASQEEIETAAAFTEIDNRAFLFCVSGYPTPIEESQLGRLALVRGANTSVFGISDHTQGWEVPVAATALGATIIEKHLTLSHGLDTEDAAFSLEPHEFHQMAEACRSIWRAMQPSEAKSEESSRQLRRSLYVTQDIKAGGLLTKDNIRSIRPSYGLPPKELSNVLGKTAVRDLRRGEALAWNMMD